MRNLVVFYLTSIIYCCVDLPEFVHGGGTKYVIALLGQDIQNNMVTADIQYQLIISNKEESEISVQITTSVEIIKELKVGANSNTMHKLEHVMAMNGSEFSNKSLEVHSDNGKFVLQVFSKRNNYEEGLLAIPIGEMNGPNQVINRTVYEYVVATFCAVGGYCQVAIAAVENNTEVFMDIPKTVEEIALCNKSSYFRTQRDTRFTMNKFDALQIETTQDLTGTVIFSFKPIAVFVGSRNVTNGNVVAHTMEQLVPSSHWGTEFVVQTLGSNGYGDILKIVSHYTSTVVTMSGFRTFNITDRYQTVTRRLSKGKRSHIKASRPVQVVQISGLSYATKNETSTLSMSVVPSVQNAWNEFIVSCHDQHTTTQFFVVSEKDSCRDTTAGNETYDKCSSFVSESRINYTKYLIDAIRCTNGMNPTKVKNSASTINGILKCGDTVTLPLGIQYNENVTGTTPVYVSDHPGGICYEGGNATTYFSPLGTPTLPYILDLTNYQSEHVLKLRVQVCGSAILHFKTQSADDFIIAIINHQGVQITACYPKCAFHKDVSNTSDSVNMEAGIDCSSDMSFFWVFQTVGMFCIGTGYQHKPEMCVEDWITPDNLIRIITNSSNVFNNVSMIGQFSDATFNWDFIHVNGCKEYQNGWRCVDKFWNCSQYEDGFCSAYRDFASINCAKFCGICFPDTYGRKFLVKTHPRKPEDCSILISPLNQQVHVAVISFLKWGSDEYETVYHGTRDKNGVLFYNYTKPKEMVHTIAILSDDDVAVVMYQKNGEVIKVTRMYPVDTFGNEFMILEHDTKEKDCIFLSEEDNVEYTAYYSGKKKGENGARDSVSEQSNIYEIFSLEIGNDMSGTIFTFTRPSSVFCFDNEENIYNQLLPIDTWSSVYVVPSFDIDTVNYTFTGILHIVSTADNTVVNISGGFDAIHALYNKGDKIEQMIDLTTAYKVVASERVGVGLYINDSSDPPMSSFTLLAPVQNLHDTVLTSVFINEIIYNEAANAQSGISTSYIDPNLSSRMNHTDYLNGELSFQTLHTGKAVYEMTLVHSNSAWDIVPGNIKTKWLTQPKKNICRISTAIPNDKKDNDCDGWTDESRFYDNVYGVYREDDDLDGDFADDYGGNKVSSVHNATNEPVCFEVKQVPGQCWKACSCKCSWVEKFNKEKNMTHEQLIEAQKQYIVQHKKALTINYDKLTATKAGKISAFDRRKSASNIGYTGIALFVVTFIIVLIMDLGALKRDVLILVANLKDGYESICEFNKAKFCRKKEEVPLEMTNIK